MVSSLMVRCPVTRPLEVVMTLSTLSLVDNITIVKLNYGNLILVKNVVN
jgi:hypothetical protein